MTGFVFNARMAGTEAPPVMEARRWIEGKEFPADKPLLNLSQAAPIAPPPEPLREAMAEMIRTDPSVHLYGPVLGLPELRAAIARDWSALYGGRIAETQVAVTAGCNEAFAAAMAALVASPRTRAAAGQASAQRPQTSQRSRSMRIPSGVNSSADTRPRVTRVNAATTTEPVRPATGSWTAAWTTRSRK